MKHRARSFIQVKCKLVSEAMLLSSIPFEKIKLSILSVELYIFSISFHLCSILMAHRSIDRHYEYHNLFASTKIKI